MQKGLELPLNAIIIIALAVLVLVAIAGFFFQFYSGSDIDTKKLFAEGCVALRSFNSCDHKKINEMGIQEQSFGSICSRSGYADTVQCAKACGCSTQGEKGQALNTKSSSNMNSNNQPGPEQSQNSETTIEVIGVNIL